MKVVIGLFLLIVVLGVGAFKLGWFTPDDPKALAAEIRDSVKVGMTWQEVVDIRRPRKYARVKPGSMTGKTDPIDFDPAKIEEDVKINGYPYGFVFRYTFSASDVVEVFFDGSGNVQWVEDPMTVSDLFNGSAP